MRRRSRVGIWRCIGESHATYPKLPAAQAQSPQGDSSSIGCMKDEVGSAGRPLARGGGGDLFAEVATRFKMISRPVRWLAVIGVHQCPSVVGPVAVADHAPIPTGSNHPLSPITLATAGNKSSALAKRARCDRNRFIALRAGGQATHITRKPHPGLDRTIEQWQPGGSSEIGKSTRSCSRLAICDLFGFLLHAPSSFAFHSVGFSRIRILSTMPAKKPNPANTAAVMNRQMIASSRGLNPRSRKTWVNQWPALSLANKMPCPPIKAATAPKPPQVAFPLELETCDLFDMRLAK